MEAASSTPVDSFIWTKKWPLTRVKSLIWKKSGRRHVSKASFGKKVAVDTCRQLHPDEKVAVDTCRQLHPDEKVTVDTCRQLHLDEKVTVDACRQHCPGEKHRHGDGAPALPAPHHAVEAERKPLGRLRQGLTPSLTLRLRASSAARARQAWHRSACRRRHSPRRHDDGPREWKAPSGWKR